MAHAAELHGLFQCLRVQGEDLASSGGAEPADYKAFLTEPGWFFSEDLVAQEAAASSNKKLLDPTDFTVAKLQIDYLYFHKKYEEALPLAVASFQHHLASKSLCRELVDAMIKCAQSAGGSAGRSALVEALAWLEQGHIQVKDPGVAWLAISINAGLEDWHGALRACDHFLELRPGELEIWLLKKRYLSALLESSAAPLESLAHQMADINKTIRALEYNLSR